jgi:hypothetical protein
LTASCGQAWELKLPFQQVRDQDDQTTLQLAEVALAHVLELFDQVRGIDVAFATRAQQRDLLGNPGVEVPAVKVRMPAYGAAVCARRSCGQALSVSRR